MLSVSFALPVTHDNQRAVRIRRPTVKIKLLPSTFDEHGRPCVEQRLSCYLVDDILAIDAGSLGLAIAPHERTAIRDIIITHTHIDHIASLPIFIDDSFEYLEQPVRVYATAENIQRLEDDIFNWHTYPRFSELSNGRCRVMEYVTLQPNETFSIKHLTITPIPVHHAVPTVGLLLTSQDTHVAYSADTGATDEFWQVLNRLPHLDALFIECSFSNALSKLAIDSGHLTPALLDTELEKLRHLTSIYAVHIKPSYRDVIMREIAAFGRTNLHIAEPGLTYEW